MDEKPAMVEFDSGAAGFGAGLSGSTMAYVDLIKGDVKIQNVYDKKEHTITIHEAMAFVELLSTKVEKVVTYRAR